MLIVNADDWGRDTETTDRIAECAALGSVSSVSAMVFMEDSERAASIALDNGFEAGLHLNFTTPFSASACPSPLLHEQRRLAQHLLRHRLSPMLFAPHLIRPFENVIAAQLEEFRRLYGTSPEKLDGHHHMHLCTNVIFQRLLPKQILVRRNFSFESGEKSYLNRTYRRFLDRMLSRNHSLTDYFFSIVPMEPRQRLQKIFALAAHATVELETHPIEPNEYRFLTQGEFFHQLGSTRIVPAAFLAKASVAGV
jgi:predicted glycoside hydrolase/deacetylase ChbG (UPF0249 family)